jgi:hypothetical protein
LTGAAVTGDLLIGVARNRGAVGFVTDGVVRDLAAREALNVPVNAIGVSAIPAGDGRGRSGCRSSAAGVRWPPATSLSPTATALRSPRANE